MANRYSTDDHLGRLSKAYELNSVDWRLDCLANHIETDDTLTYKIVGEDEADLEQNKISVNSPIARALIGKKEGDTLVIPIPKGSIELEVLEVEFLA